MLSMIPRSGMRIIARRLVMERGIRDVTQRVTQTKKTAIALCPSWLRPAGVGRLNIPQKAKTIRRKKRGL